MEEKIIGCEIEVYQTPSSYMMVDLNPGKLGGAKRFGSFAGLDSQANGLETRIGNIARSFSWDVRDDCYIVFDMSLGIQEVEGRTYISPLVYEIKRAIEDRGYKVKGFVGRDKIFSEKTDNWKSVEVNDKLEVTNVIFDNEVLSDLANTQSVYLGCHFAPRSCEPNNWNEDTCRNGFINNFLDLPGINWLFMRESEFSPYKDAFVFSRANGLNVRDENISVARGDEELHERCEEMRRKGHRYATIKDLARMSIGGRNISFMDLNQLEDIGKIPPTALVMPYFHTEPTIIGEERVILQTRMVYSSINKSEPEFVFAKMYPVNGTNSLEPLNLSSTCTDFVVWDLQDGMYHLRSPVKGRLSINRSSLEEQVALRMYFESAIKEMFPEIKKVEKRLQEEGTDYSHIYHFYKKMKKQRFVPDNIHPFLNLFMRR